MKNETVLIIGNCIAGISCAETLRQYKFDGKIIMLSREKYPAYGRPLISYYLAGKIKFENIFLRDDDFYKDLDIDLRMETTVAKIDFKKKIAFSDEGAEIKYDRILIAAGGNPFVPPIKGTEGVAGVTTFTTLEDSLKIEEDLDQIDHVVILGAGLIGLKAAEALSYRNKKIHMVELADRVLPAVLDQEGSQYFQNRMEQDEIEFHFGQTVKNVISSKGKVTDVELSDGTSLPCDLLIVAIGVRPNLDFVDTDQLDCGRGIKVDRKSKTNIDGVYAAGDVSEAYDLMYNIVRNMPIWPNAYWQGKFAAYDMVGKEYDFMGHIVMNSIAYKDVPMISAGIVEDPKLDIAPKVIKTDDSYRRFNFQDDKLVGMLFIKDILDKGVLIHLLNHQELVSELKDKIMAEEFSFVDFPREYRQTHLDAAHRKI